MVHDRRQLADARSWFDNKDQDREVYLPERDDVAKHSTYHDYSKWSATRKLFCYDGNMTKKNVYRVNPIRYFLPGEGITHKIIENVGSRKTVFYSSVLALSSAALAFLGQLTLGSQSQNPGILMTISIASFGFAILTLVLIYFLHIVHSTYWGKIELYYEKMHEVEPDFNINDAVRHKYFKQNPKDLGRFKDAMYISARLMALEVKLYLLLLILIFIGVIFYCVKLIGF